MDERLKLDIIRLVSRSCHLHKFDCYTALEWLDVCEASDPELCELIAEHRTACFEFEQKLYKFLPDDAVL